MAEAAHDGAAHLTRLLNLAFSTQAAYAAPLILLAGNRSAARRIRAAWSGDKLDDAGEKMARVRSSVEAGTAVDEAVARVVAD